MSSTNRGKARERNDFYATPPWAVHRLLDFLSEEDLPRGRWFEPCGGDGAIIQAVNDALPNQITWTSAEFRPETRPLLEPLSPGGVRIGDFLTLPEDHFGSELFDVIITNPPFLLAEEFLRKSMRMAKRTAFLLRLNFWGSMERYPFFKRYPADTYILPQRPIFALNKHGKPGTDSIEYCWYLFDHESKYEPGNKRNGRINVLGLTPSAERKAWTEKLKRDAAMAGNSETIEESCDSSDSSSSVVLVSS